MPIRAAYIAYRFLKEALHRLVGVDREASVLTTAFTITVLATALRPVAAPLFRAARPKPPPLPSFASGAMGVAAARHLTSSIGGEPLRNTPYANVIIATGLVAPAFRLVALPVHLVQAAFAGVVRGWRYVTGAAAPRPPG